MSRFYPILSGIYKHEKSKADSDFTETKEQEEGRMIYYRLDGFHHSENWLGAGDEEKLLRSRVRKVAGRTQVYNARLAEETYFFVSMLTTDAVKIGVIQKNVIPMEKLQKRLDSYLRDIGLKLKETVLQETTFEDIRNMLQAAWRKDTNLEDDDDVLERFNLHSLVRDFQRKSDFKEDLLPETKTKDLYDNVYRIPMRETIVPELDRICSGPDRIRPFGHPVHYFIETDDCTVRKTVVNTVLGALFNCHRLRIRRFCTLNISGTSGFSKSVLECIYSNSGGGAVILDCTDLGTDDDEDDCASTDRYTIERLSGPVRNYANSVLTIICLPKGAQKLREMFSEYLGSMTFVELKEECMADEEARNFLTLLAKDSKIRPDRNLYAELEPQKGYLVTDLRDLFNDWFNRKLKITVYPQYREMASMRKKSQETKARGSAWEELNELVGLEEAKKTIRRALNYYKAQNLFAGKGMKTDHPAIHMVFTGNPGTAKTTVARLFARIMRDNKLLETGRFVECGRGDLVGKYVGWTAPTIQRKFMEAGGGVLFIDEAYSLVDDRNGSFGDEAINTIVQEMENHRDDTIVIFAGYPDKMEEFIRKNPGLRSRIAFHVHFEDYSAQELTEIAIRMAGKNGISFTEDAIEKIRLISGNALHETGFGNGRFVRNMLEKARMAQADRLLSLDESKITRKDVTTLLAEDIEIPPQTAETARRIGF